MWVVSPVPRGRSRADAGGGHQRFRPVVLCVTGEVAQVPALPGKQLGRARSVGIHVCVCMVG